MTYRSFTPATYACPLGFKILSIELCHARSTIPGQMFDACSLRCDGKWREKVPLEAWVVCEDCGTLNIFDYFNTCPVCGWQSSAGSGGTENEQ